jgi:hypothetical protein
MSDKSGQQKLVEVLERLIGDTPVATQVALKKMKHGTHRPITKAGIELLRQSFDTYGALPESLFVLKEIEEDKEYEIIEGNHRKVVWQENGYATQHNNVTPFRITDWPCYVIPQSATLSFMDYHVIAGSYNDIHSNFTVKPTDSVRLRFLYNLLKNSGNQFTTRTGYNYQAIFEASKAVTVQFASQERVEQYMRSLVAVAGDKLDREDILNMVWIQK